MRERVCGSRLLWATATDYLQSMRWPDVSPVLLDPSTQEAAHALGEKHTGLAKVLENAGVKEQHDIAGLKQAMQASDSACDVFHLSGIRRLSLIVIHEGSAAREIRRRSTYSTATLILRILKDV